MSIVYISIGSNLGNKKSNCLHAIELLEKRGIIVKKRSSIHETEPWGVKDQPPFLNMAIEVETALKPEELLVLLKNVETEVGREKTYQWGPRIIDLDILLFNSIILNTDDLTIPHPYMHERDFVLRPLNEIAPGVKHPLLKLSVSELLQNFKCKSSGRHGVS
jgi:2-amino-4-hydroxy-6-hydroxymethyldihydropteridine diphosphokinase